MSAHPAGCTLPNYCGKISPVMQCLPTFENGSKDKHTAVVHTALRKYAGAASVRVATQTVVHDQPSHATSASVAEKLVCFTLTE